jgi:DNA-binding NarL/FixJ family response regulator
LVREALAALLRQLGPGVEVLEAASLAAAASCVAAHPVLSLVILDLTLPDATGIAAVERLLRDRPDLPVIVLSAKDDPATARAALDAGARGFVSKRSPTRVLTEALRLVVVGGTYVPSLQEDAPVARKDPPPDADVLAFAAHKSLGLTPRQLDVLALLVQGKPNKLICRALEMAEGTLKTHIAAIYRALHVENRTQAVFALSRLGLTLSALLTRPVPACAAPTDATRESSAAPGNSFSWHRVLGATAN